MPRYGKIKTSQFICSHDDDRLVLYAGDHFDYKSLQQAITKLGTPWIIIGDVEGTILDLPAPFYFVPELIMGMSNWVNQGLGKINDFEKDFQTKHCFCWSINRLTIDRYLVIKILEWFNLHSPYTWTGFGKSTDCSSLFDEMSRLKNPWFTQDFRSFLLAPVSLLPRFVEEPYGRTSDPLIRGPIGNVTSQWHNVQKELASTSAVYLLTESSTNQEKNYTFTEKTGWALLAANFPIWAGNYGQAHQASIMGIDIFDDVINHDYQWYDTLIERCYHAIYDNMDLLTDLDLAQELRNKHRGRLLSNRDWYINGGLRRYVDSQKTILNSLGVDIDRLRNSLLSTFQ